MNDNNIKLPPLPPQHIVPSVEPVDYPEVAQALMDYAREAVRMNRCESRASTHAEGCWNWGPGHYGCAVGQVERLKAENERLRSILIDLKDWDCDVRGGFLSIPVDLRRRMQDALATFDQDRGKV